MLFFLGLHLSELALQRQLSFTHLDIEDGLIHNQINCIMKDAKGFIWLGTPSGLSRYDGKHFLNFRHNSADSTSLADNYIEAIYTLPGGWYGPDYPKHNGSADDWSWHPDYAGNE